MKKVLAFILTIICLVMLVACDTNTDQSQNNAQPAYLSGKVIEIYESGCLLEVTDEGNYGKLAVGTTVEISTNVENCPEFVVGDYLTVEFDGTVAESYPPQILHVLVINKIDSYSVKVENDEFLYEKLNDKYKEGEQVVVKTEILLDASITVYVNGESIGMGKAIETGDEYTHWEYYFTMPSKDVVIKLEVTDGFLP